MMPRPETDTTVAVLLLSITLLCVTILADAPAAGIEALSERFFLMGDGKLHIRNAHTGQEAGVTLLNPDGSLNEQAFSAVDRVFGFPTGEMGEHISPRLIFMLDHFSDLAAPGKVVNLVSGYRSPRYNSKLRNAGGNVAKTSTHIDGIALDFFIDGVSGRELWDLIRKSECCGVGHYGGNNVHLDAARPRFWEAATSKVRTGESDFNRRIYLSTEYDRYRAGETARLSFSSVSDFGFGVLRVVSFVDDAGGNGTALPSAIRTADDAECIPMHDRTATRFIYVDVPPGLAEGRYRVKVDFCHRPFEQMPLQVLSNPIEIQHTTIIPPATGQPEGLPASGLQ